MRAADLPPVFARYVGKVHYVRRVSENEYSSECPKCGGAPHDDGEWPDRLRWFLNGKPCAWCRRCGSLFWPDDTQHAQPTREQLDAWKAEQIKREEARKRSAEIALKHLRDGSLWERYYSELEQSPQAQAYWEKRGIPGGWQSFWKLGWDAEHEVRTREMTYHVTTATIPVFAPDWQILQIRHRVINPPDGCPKYYPEVFGQPSPIFLTDPGAELTGRVYAIEGEIKSMVVKARLDDNTTIVGLPGTNPGAQITTALAKAEQIIVVLDPGAEKEAHRLAETLGSKRCRVLITPQKIDDGIIQSDLSKQQIKRLFASARPAGAML